MALAVAGYLYRPVDHGPLDPRPVVIPPRLNGLSPGANQLLGRSTELLKERFGPYQNGNATYGSFATKSGQTEIYSLVLARGRFEDMPDIETGRPPYSQHGQVRCTHSYEYKGKVTTVKLLTWCSRIEDQLTVSVVGMGALATEERTAAAVEEAWAAQDR